MKKQKVKLGKSVDQKLDKLTTAVGAITLTLGKMATKDDLSGFATKDDLSSFATKDDLSGFATKDDLSSFATKDDLSSFATKDDLNAFAKKDKVDYLIDEVERLGSAMVTKEHFEDVITLFKQDFDEFKDYVYENLVTRKEFENRFHDYQDALGEMRDHRRSRLLFEGQHVDLQNTVAKHENRIVVLEKKLA